MKEFDVFYLTADYSRSEIIKKIKAQHPEIKGGRIWELYNGFDCALLPEEYVKIPGRNGKFCPRFTNAHTLEIICKFDSFVEMGCFIDRITANENAIQEYQDENWRLVSVEHSDWPLFSDYKGKTSKDTEIFIVYELEE